MNTNFMDKTAKIIAEIRSRTCIDDDVEVIKEILQDELKEYYDALHECYADGYDDGYAACKSILEGDVDNAYDEGYELGYYEGLSDGRSEGYQLGHYDGHSEGYSEGHAEVKTLLKMGQNMSDYSIKLGDSVGSGVHVHSQGEIYPVIQMYIGQEKVFTYANKVVPYSMKQQVVDAVADGTPAIRELFSTSTRELRTF